MTTIEWTDRTWNPTVGCSKVSPGCDRCYAVTVAQRGMQPAHRGLTSGGDWTGEIRPLPDRLDTPLRVRKPTRWFVDSMADLFHPGTPGPFIAEVFNTMARCPQHTFQILTKRPQRMRAVLDALSWDGQQANIELGVSIESDSYTWRARHLRATPATTRFVSLEPLLGPLPSLDLTGIHWVIAGAESGHGARPMDLDWVRQIRDRCLEAAVPFFFKQDATNGKKVATPELDGRRWTELPHHTHIPVVPR